jgi:hypothetical protein
MSVEWTFHRRVFDAESHVVLTEVDTDDAVLIAALDVLDYTFNPVFVSGDFGSKLFKGLTL